VGVAARLVQRLAGRHVVVDLMLRQRPERDQRPGVA
jgi:hypothetical protein